MLLFEAIPAVRCIFFVPFAKAKAQKRMSLPSGLGYSRKYMENFQLTPFLNIDGIGAASGLVHHDNTLYIISDSSSFLYAYSLTSHTLQRIALLQNAQENTLKKEKQDFESITLKANELHIFGSGSTNHRNKKIIFNIHTGTILEEDFTTTYDYLKNTFHLSDNDLNIEGVLYDKETIILFQRGNGLGTENGLFKSKKDNSFEFIPITLPKIKHVETSFTDAILVDQYIYFLAAAEDTISTYDDGEILGSIMGCIHLKTGKLEDHIQISAQHKFEGLTLWSQNKTDIEFLLCQDSDTEETNSTIYKLSIQKP